MASTLIYAGVQGYKKYQLKRSNSAAEHPPKSKRDRKSISSLVIPSVTTAHFQVIDEKRDDSNLPQYEHNEYTAPYSPDSIGVPSRKAPPPPVMLGLTLCESPSTPMNELHGYSLFDFKSSQPSDLDGQSPRDYSREVFELPGDSPMSEPLSPAPLHVVKRGSSPMPPELIFSSDESEDEPEEYHHAPESSSHLQVPESAEELLDFEAPPIPPKSPARKLRVASNWTNSCWKIMEIYCCSETSEFWWHTCSGVRRRMGYDHETEHRFRI